MIFSYFCSCLAELNPDRVFLSSNFVGHDKLEHIHNCEHGDCP
jgi:hypothetical protein